MNAFEFVLAIMFLMFVFTIVRHKMGIPLRSMKEMREGVTRFVTSSRERLRRAIKAGVPIAAGSDMYYQLGSRSRGEASHLMFRAYRDAGMSPIDVIRAATVNAADLLGWSDRIGSVEKGKLADLIAVEADPLEDVTALENVVFVMKGGEIVKSASR